MIVSSTSTASSNAAISVACSFLFAVASSRWWWWWWWWHGKSRVRDFLGRRGARPRLLHAAEVVRNLHALPRRPASGTGTPQAAGASLTFAGSTASASHLLPPAETAWKSVRLEAGKTQPLVSPAEGLLEDPSSGIPEEALLRAGGADGSLPAAGADAAARAAVDAVLGTGGRQWVRSRPWRWVAWPRRTWWWRTPGGARAREARLLWRGAAVPDPFSIVGYTGRLKICRRDEGMPLAGCTAATQSAQRASGCHSHAGPGRHRRFSPPAAYPGSLYG